MSKTIEEILVPKPEARPRIYAYAQPPATGGEPFDFMKPRSVRL